MESRNHGSACSKSDRRKLQFTISAIRAASFQATTLPSTSIRVKSTSSKPLLTAGPSITKRSNELITFTDKATYMKIISIKAKPTR